jgi:DNA-directed RNA polymerase specialized sigma24 family protein
VTDERVDVRCRVRVRLRSWPAVDDSTALWLWSLPWRTRRVVVLTHGEECTRDQVSARLRLSIRTVSRCLDDAYESFEDAFQGEYN